MRITERDFLALAAEVERLEAELLQLRAAGEPGDAGGAAEGSAAVADGEAEDGDAAGGGEWGEPPPAAGEQLPMSAAPPPLEDEVDGGEELAPQVEYVKPKRRVGFWGYILGVDRLP